MILILGSGESGTGAAILALKKGYEVFVSDSGTIKDKYKNVLLHNGIGFEENKHSVKLGDNATEVIKSPGISDETPFVIQLKNKGIPVISEIEFACRYANGKKVFITGSNGKTTTTMLTHHIFKKAGLDTAIGGNVGKSFAMLTAEKDYENYILEISSFQLDGMMNSKADVAVITNITPDHLDRYNYNMQNYINSKFRVLNNQTKNDAFVYCADDSIIMAEIAKRSLCMKTYPIKIKSPVKGEGAFVFKKEIIIRIKSNEYKMNIESLALQGTHNIYNSMAAAVTASINDIRKEDIKEALRDFQHIEHRLEFVTKIHGVDFINDSKATNVNSAWYALESMTKPVIWIAGGQDKGNDYSALKELAATKVKAIVCLGVDNKKIHKEFKNIVPEIIDADSIKKAVETAYSLSAPGDVVLLSPACASFDRFNNFEERGNLFKIAVFEI